jgi:hypothetical protein
MSARLEAYLARLYVDPDVRRAFLADARTAATQAGLAPTEIAALERIDRTGLELAARSFARTRAAQRSPSRLARRIRGWLAHRPFRGCTLLRTTLGGVAWPPPFRSSSPSRRRWD